ncbi:MAG: hypothetical protein AAFP04_16635, partial [Myxococcota bacterium]
EALARRAGTRRHIACMQYTLRNVPDAFDRETYQMWSRGEIEFLVDPELLNTEPDVHDETITTEQLRWMYEKLREVRQKEAAEKNDGGNEDSQRQP